MSEAGRAGEPSQGWEAASWEGVERAQLGTMLAATPAEAARVARGGDASRPCLGRPGGGAPGTHSHGPEVAARDGGEQAEPEPPADPRDRPWEVRAAGMAAGHAPFPPPPAARDRHPPRPAPVARPPSRALES